VIEDSFQPGATFMNSVLLVRFDTGSSRILHNMTFIESKGESVSRKHLETMEGVVGAIEEVFGIPQAISRVALEGVSMHRDAWS
jgi:hypothetical protein